MAAAKPIEFNNRRSLVHSRTVVPQSLSGALISALLLASAFAVVPVSAQEPPLSMTAKDSEIVNMAALAAFGVSG